MRKALGKRAGERIKVYAKVSRFGKKSAYRGVPLETVCLVNLRDEQGKWLCDHLWLTVGKQIADLRLKEEDEICFFARVMEYTKGYFGRRADVSVPVQTDYKLSHPTKFAKIANRLPSEHS